MTKFKSQALHVIKIKYWKASGSGNPPSLIPTLRKIAILALGLKTGFGQWYIGISVRGFEWVEILSLTLVNIVSAFLKTHNLSAYIILAYLSDSSWIVNSSLHSSSNALCQISPIFEVYFPKVLHFTTFKFQGSINSFFVSQSL